MKETSIGLSKFCWIKGRSSCISILDCVRFFKHSGVSTDGQLWIWCNSSFPNFRDQEFTSGGTCFANQSWTTTPHHAGHHAKEASRVFLLFCTTWVQWKTYSQVQMVKDHINWCMILSNRIDHGISVNECRSRIEQEYEYAVILSMNGLGYAQAEDMGKFCWKGQIKLQQTYVYIHSHHKSSKLDAHQHLSRLTCQHHQHLLLIHHSWPTFIRSRYNIYILIFPKHVLCLVHLVNQSPRQYAHICQIIVLSIDVYVKFLHQKNSIRQCNQSRNHQIIHIITSMNIILYVSMTFSYITQPQMIRFQEPTWHNPPMARHEVLPILLWRSPSVLAFGYALSQVGETWEGPWGSSGERLQPPSYTGIYLSTAMVSRAAP